MTLSFPFGTVQVYSMSYLFFWFYLTMDRDLQKKVESEDYLTSSWQTKIVIHSYFTFKSAISLAWVLTVTSSSWIYKKKLTFLHWRRQRFKNHSHKGPWSCIFLNWSWWIWANFHNGKNILLTDFLHMLLSVYCIYKYILMNIYIYSIYIKYNLYDQFISWRLNHFKLRIIVKTLSASSSYIHLASVGKPYLNILNTLNN